MLGGSAKAAGDLVKQAGAKTFEYIFVIGIGFLKGYEKLDAPSYWIIEVDNEGLTVDKEDLSLSGSL